MPIPERENLFRHCIHPHSFASKAFNTTKYIAIREKNGVYKTSLAWERFVPEVPLVHAYGCSLAQRMNGNDQASGRYREANKKIYCGAYQLNAGSIRALSDIRGIPEIESIDVVHCIEDGAIAHANLEIVFKDTKDLDLEGAKTAVVDRLWSMMSGPLLHVCACDSEINSHPNLKLPVGPKGVYSDHRSRAVRLWFMIRYSVLSWLWLKWPNRANR